MTVTLFKTPIPVRFNLVQFSPFVPPFELAVTVVFNFCPIVWPFPVRLILFFFIFRGDIAPLAGTFLKFFGVKSGHELFLSKALWAKG